MKLLVVVGTVAIAGMSSPGWAGCVDAGYAIRLNSENTIKRALDNRRVDATAPDGENWKEDHCVATAGSPGALYKVGDGTTVDPRALKGRWRPRDFGSRGWGVQYQYGDPGSPIYNFALYTSTPPRGLCWEDAGGNTVATDVPPLGSNPGPCP